VNDDARIAAIEARLSSSGFRPDYDNAPRASAEIPAWLVAAVPVSPTAREVGSTDRFALGDTKLEALQRLEVRVFGES